jgi:hypothetical protein
MTGINERACERMHLGMDGKVPKSQVHNMTYDDTVYLNRVVKRYSNQDLVRLHIHIVGGPGINMRSLVCIALIKH